MITEKKIYVSLCKALSDYSRDCKEKSAGSEGVKRKAEFELLLNYYDRGKVDFLAICKFFQKQTHSSRLRNHIQNSLLTIFEIPTPTVSHTTGFASIFAVNFDYSGRFRKDKLVEDEIEKFKLKKTSDRKSGVARKS